jgi:hypothetical protein
VIIPELHFIVGIMKACCVEAYDKIGRGACLLHVGFFLDLFFEPENGRDVISKRRPIFAGIQGVISRRKNS